MAGKKSRDKGKRGERECVHYLRSLGFEDAMRTQQYNGKGKSDVVCPESLPHVHIEVKYGDGVKLGCASLMQACHQAARDSHGKPWCVLWRPTGVSQWRMTFDMTWRVTVADDSEIDSALRAVNGLGRSSESLDVILQ